MAKVTVRHPRQPPTQAQKEAAYDRLIAAVLSWPDPVETKAPPEAVDKLSSPEVERRVSRAYDAIEQAGEIWQQYKQEHPEVA